MPLPKPGTIYTETRTFADCGECGGQLERLTDIFGISRSRQLQWRHRWGFEDNGFACPTREKV